RSPRSDGASSYASDAVGAETVVDASWGGGSGQGVVGERGVDGGAGGERKSLAPEDALERGEAEKHVLALGRMAHGPDAPDPTLQRPERGADLDAEVLDEPVAHPELVDSVRHHDRRDERQAMGGRLLAEQGQPERGEAGAQRVAVEPMPRPPRGQPFVNHGAP